MEIAETEKAIATPNIAALQQQTAYTDDTFGGISGTRFNFHPRLQLFTSNSEQVKDGSVPLANFGLIVGKDAKPKVLGTSVPVVPLAWRAKAMFVKSDPPLTYHNPQSQEFKDIRASADRDSNSGNMYGPEFLMWIPSEKTFATFFMGSKTARNEAPAIRSMLPTAEGRLRLGVLTAKFIKTKDYSWHGPVFTPSAQSFEEPPVDVLEQTVADFLNPQDSVVKQAPQDTDVPDAR